MGVQIPHGKLAVLWGFTFDQIWMSANVDAVTQVSVWWWCGPSPNYFGHLLSLVLLSFKIMDVDCASFGDVLMLVLDHFPSSLNPVIHRPHVGAPLTLRCHPPKSFPGGMVYWGEYKFDGRLEPLQLTDRISLDYNGITLSLLWHCWCCVLPYWMQYICYCWLGDREASLTHNLLAPLFPRGFLSK